MIQEVYHHLHIKWVSFGKLDNIFSCFLHAKIAQRTCVSNFKANRKCETSETNQESHVTACYIKEFGRRADNCFVDFELECSFTGGNGQVRIRSRDE